jgi:hypothetical protein
MADRIAGCVPTVIRPRMPSPVMGGSLEPHDYLSFAEKTTFT